MSGRGTLYEPSTQAGRDAISTAAAKVAWSPPRALMSFPRPSMPVDCFPPAMADFVESVKSSTQTPTELAGMLMLAAGAIPLAKRVEVKLSVDWIEPLQLFAVVQMESGERKSAVFRLVTQPIRSYERIAAEQAEQDVVGRESDRRVLMARIDHYEKRLAREDDATERLTLEANLKDERAKLTGLPPLYAEILFLDDVTPEALHEEMARQGGRMAIMSPEGGTFSIMAGTYSDGDARLDLYLKGHAGEDVRVTRMTRSTYIRDAALTLALAVQRSTLEEAFSNPAFVGRGLLARTLIACPQSNIGSRDLTPPTVDQDVRLAYADMMDTLLQCSMTTDENGVDVPHTLTLSPGADDDFLAFRGRIEPQLRDGGTLGTPSLRSWGSKLPGAVARIAGILHCAERASKGLVPTSGKITSETMRNAIRLGADFLLPHAVHAFRSMGADPGLGLAERALALIARRGMEIVSRRDLQRELGLSKVEQADEAIRVLEEHGYLRQRETIDTARKPGRKPSPEYDVNPMQPMESETPKQFDVFDRTDDIPRRAA